MEKILKLSRILSYIFAVYIVINIIDIFAYVRYSDLYLLICLVIKFITLLWFALIIRKSNKTSPILIPSYIGISGVSCSIISSIITLVGLNYADYYLIISQEIISILAIVLHTITFIFLSIYFKKGSLIQILAIALAILPLMLFIFTFFFGNLYASIGNILIGLLWMSFMFKFSKLKK